MFDSTEARIICRNLQVKLNEIGKEMGVSLVINGYRFGQSINFKVECSKIENGKAIDRASVDFMRYAELFELPQDSLGKTFRCRGRVYEITGLNPRSHIYPVSCKRDDGTIFKFRVEDVKRYLGVG